MNKEKRVAEIRRILEARETEDLLEFWVANDREEWTDEAFIAIQSIFQDRLGEIPPQTPRYQPVDLLDKSDLVLRATRYLERAAEYLDLGEYDKAMRACESAIRIAPHLATAYNYLGLSYDGLGELEDAIGAYREAVRLDPNFGEAREHLREAEVELEQVSQFDPAMEHLDQAVAYVDEGELEDALRECDLAIQLAPFLAVAQNYRGMILEQLEQLDEAIDAYHAAVQLDPEFYAARENLGCARIKWEEALFRQPMQEDLNLEISPDDVQELDETLERYSGRLPAFYLDEKAFILRGWPGNRTRPGRSGYDPLDTEFEMAHMGGVILRLLFTSRFRTRNPIYLFLMFFSGCIGCLSLLFTLAEAFNGHPRALFFNVIFTPYIVVGAALLWNAFLSLLDWEPDEI